MGGIITIKVIAIVDKTEILYIAIPTSPMTKRIFKFHILYH